MYIFQTETENLNHISIADIAFEKSNSYSWISLKDTVLCFYFISYALTSFINTLINSTLSQFKPLPVAQYESFSIINEIILIPSEKGCAHILTLIFLYLGCFSDIYKLIVCLQAKKKFS